MPTIDYTLGIETSCDETGVAIYHREGLVSDTLYSQVDLHAQYGGVVPELAARDHLNRIFPLIKQSLKEASLTLSQLDGIAYCAGPGLAGALLVGTAVGRTLGWALDKPTVGVHHLEAHLLSPLLDSNNRVPFPFVALLVSGGHTLLVHVHAVGHYTLLGETRDDAVGEAFDKTAKLLGLGYPGGAALAELAERGDPHRFNFPRPLLDRPTLDFSFSGLKTHVSRCWMQCGEDETQKANIARAFEEAVVDILTQKSLRALAVTGLNHLVIAGGVSANQRLRSTLTKKLDSLNGHLHCPPLKLCTDNGAMIAYTGFLKLQQQLDTEPLSIQVNPRWSIETQSV